MTKALSPNEADELRSQGHSIPPEVIEAVNDLIVTKPGNFFSLMISDVKRAISDKMGISTADILDHWLDFEPVYRKAGWSVHYDRPGYNENYEGHYKFNKAN
jgi:hypothetical protein